MPREACSQNRPQTARDAFKMFEERLEAGEHSPYKHRLTDRERWEGFKRMIDDRGIRYARCTLENFTCTTGRQREVVELLRQFFADLPRHLTETIGGGLVLFGQPGTGKDHLLAACLREAILEHGFRVRWSDGIRMYHCIKAAISTNTTEEVIGDLVKPQILAISDPLPPNAELTGYELGCLRDIVDRRYSRGLSTWITTNVQNPEEAKERLTSALLGRLLDNAVEVMCDWEGYRRPFTKVS